MRDDHRKQIRFVPEAMTLEGRSIVSNLILGVSPQIILSFASQVQANQSKDLGEGNHIDALFLSSLDINANDREQFSFRVISDATLGPLLAETRSINFYQNCLDAQFEQVQSRVEILEKSDLGDSDIFIKSNGFDLEVAGGADRAGSSEVFKLNQPMKVDTRSGLPFESSGIGQPGKIRPLTMGPTIPDQQRVAFTDAQSGEPTSGSGDNPVPSNASGGGTPPSSAPPTLTVSGGNAGAQQKVDVNNQSIPGQFFLPTPVPVGTVLYCTATPPAGSTLIISSSLWFNGSNYSEYFSTAATDIPPHSQEAPKPPINSEQGYKFIIGLEPLNYNISVFVTYANSNVTGESFCTFSTVQPTSSLTQTRIGTQGVFNSLSGFQGVQLNPGIAIKASAATGNYTAGNFMFMQIVESIDRAFATNTSGFYTYRKNDKDWRNPAFPDRQNFDGPLLDGGTFNADGTTSELSRASYPFQLVNAQGNPPPPSTSGGGSSAPQFYQSWHLAANSQKPDPTLTHDIPQMQDLPGQGGFNLTSVRASDVFSTYLMYKPDPSGVWIALRKLSWSWSASGTVIAGVMTGPSSLQQAAVATTPSGINAFPAWVNNTKNFRIEMYNPYREGFS